MKPNIFLIECRSYEDQLTAYWHYVLSTVPGVGQLFVNELSRLSGLPRATFLGAIDHPVGDTANHPDLLLQCDQYNVLFEHKLDSPLGPRQLHRYVDLATRNGWHLGLVSASRIDIDDDVCRSEAYVCPKIEHRNHPPHFLWQDIQVIVAGSTHPLAIEFCEYLEALGLGKFSWAGLGNPFINEDAAAALCDLYRAIQPVFTTPGVRFQVSTNSLIYQVRKPFAPVHLINVGPIGSVAQAIPALRGPVMGLWVWLQRAAGQRGRVLRNLNAVLQCTEFVITSEDHTAPLGVAYDPFVFCERSYYVPLDQILSNSIAETERRLVMFVRAAIDHLRKELSAGPVTSTGVQATDAAAKTAPAPLNPPRYPDEKREQEASRSAQTLTIVTRNRQPKLPQGLFNPGSEVCHSALSDLAVVLDQLGFKVRKRSSQEATLRVYVPGQKYPLLNPRFEARAVSRGRGRSGGFLIFSVFSKGDEQLDARLRTFNSNLAGEFTADAHESGGYHYHGEFVIPLSTDPAKGSIAFDALRESLLEIARVCRAS